jgi:sulfate permease, SulP family
MIARSNWISAAQLGQPRFLDLFTPKLVTLLGEGYSLRDFRADAIAGLTVAIVAIPLSMAIAIASGVSPERGLYTAIVGGFVVSAMGGSRFQIGGPAGAFIVLVAATVSQHGFDGLVLATFMAGCLLLTIGFLRLGTFIKYIPFPVTVGFTAGIAVIIFSGEIADLFGLKLAGHEPPAFVPKLQALFDAWGTFTPAAIATSVATLAIIVLVRRVRPHWPAYLVAIAVAALLASLLHLPIETIGSRFGAMPHTLPLPSLPSFSLAKLIALAPAAVSFALLGSIESLLSAVVADSMTGRRHRSNCELVAQGAANIASALFGGMCVTGTIARTATNVRAGARSPVAGMLHSIFLLLILLVAAPLAGYIPLAALATVLAAVAWNMAEKHEFATLLRSGAGDAVVLLATFLLVIFRGLTEGIVTGFGIAAVIFIHRMAQDAEVQRARPMVSDQTDRAVEDSRPYENALVIDRDIVVFRISGAFFFGAAANIAAALERTGEKPSAYVLDFASIRMLDSTAATTIAGFVRHARQHGALIALAGADPAIRHTLRTHGVRLPDVRFQARLADAVTLIRQELTQAAVARTAT